VRNSIRLCGKWDWADSVAAVGAIESSMAHIFGRGRSQMFLSPKSVNDYVGADNLVRFINDFVEGLDLAAAGFVFRIHPRSRHGARDQRAKYSSPILRAKNEGCLQKKR
jgi:hypothetical protein